MEELSMRCEEVMTREVECLKSSDSVAEAARRMSELDVGFLPVCRDDGTAVGTLTDRDIVLRVVADRQSYETDVGDVMTPNVICCRPDDDVSRAEQLMRTNQISRILCMDDEGQIAGVISLADISQYEIENESGRLLADLKGSEAHIH
jgi:CBS domain-containing protein